MDNLLSQFIAKYNGKTGQGNTAQNTGQCVGLVSLWQDVLKVPHEYGNAKDLLTNANQTYFEVFINNPLDYTTFPVPGDIIVWGDTWGNGVGHCAIIVTANGNSFTSFEQNDITQQDTNGACETLVHKDYSGVLGWLHFKNLLQGGDSVANMYGGLDLNNPESMKPCVDLFNKWKAGGLVEKTLLDQANAQIAQLSQRPVSCPPAGDPKAAQVYSHIQAIVSILK